MAAAINVVDWHPFRTQPVRLRRPPLPIPATIEQRKRPPVGFGSSRALFLTLSPLAIGQIRPKAAANEAEYRRKSTFSARRDRFYSTVRVVAQSPLRTVDGEIGASGAGEGSGGCGITA